MHCSAFVLLIVSDLEQRLVTKEKDTREQFSRNVLSNNLQLSKSQNPNDLAQYSTYTYT